MTLEQNATLNKPAFSFADVPQQTPSGRSSLSGKAIMDKYELARMARETGVNFGPKTSENLVAFAQLVAKAERDACALICDEMAGGVHEAEAGQCASAIKARTTYMV